MFFDYKKNKKIESVDELKEFVRKISDDPSTLLVKFLEKALSVLSNEPYEEFGDWTQVNEVPKPDDYTVYYHSDSSQLFEKEREGEQLDQTLIKTVYLPLDAPTIVISDLHGDYQSLLGILSDKRFFNILVIYKKAQVIFLGDLIDRGKKSVETLIAALVLKIQYPQNVTLLWGNHELARDIDKKISNELKKFFYVKNMEFNERSLTKKTIDPIKSCSDLLNKIIRCFALCAIWRQNKGQNIYLGHGMPCYSPEIFPKAQKDLTGKSIFGEYINPLDGSRFFMIKSVWAEILEDQKETKCIGIRQTRFDREARDEDILFRFPENDYIEELKKLGIFKVIAGHSHKNETLENTLYTLISTGPGSEDAWINFRKSFYY